MSSYVDNILRVYRESSNEDRTNGFEWYDFAQKFAQELSEKYEITLQQACGVISALSPRNKWEKNLIDATNMCSAHWQGIGLESVTVSTFRSNRAKAIRILNGEPVHEVITGRKTWAFYNNILDPSQDHITIDFHAANICDWEIGAKSISKKQYQVYCEAYLNVSKLLNIHPCILQAITWTTWRRERHNLVNQENNVLISP